MGDLHLTKRLLEWAAEGLEEALCQGNHSAAAAYRRALQHLKPVAG